MMAGTMYQIFSSSMLLSLGVYHLICSTRSHLKSPHTHLAKPYYPLALSFSNSSPSISNRLRQLPLYLLISCLLTAFVHQTLISSDSNPLLKGHTPVHYFTSLQFASVIFLFIILSAALLFSDSTTLLPLPCDIFFALASVIFLLQSSALSTSASRHISHLQAKCDSVSSQISLLSAFMCLILACQPRLFVAEVGLGATICLHGLWAFQTGLTLYVEAFIPEGCHRLLDVVSGVEGSTKCDLEESQLRAVAILDLLFVLHVTFVVVLVMIVYAVLSKTNCTRRLASYDPLPTAASDSNHIQMKSLSGMQA